MHVAMIVTRARSKRLLQTAEDAEVKKRARLRVLWQSGVPLDVMSLVGEFLTLREIFRFMGSVCRHWRLAALRTRAPHQQGWIGDVETAAAYKGVSADTPNPELTLTTLTSTSCKATPLIWCFPKLRTARLYTQQLPWCNNNSIPRPEAIYRSNPFPELEELVVSDECVKPSLTAMPPVSLMAQLHTLRLFDVFVDMTAFLVATSHAPLLTTLTLNCVTFRHTPGIALIEQREVLRAVTTFEMTTNPNFPTQVTDCINLFSRMPSVTDLNFAIARPGVRMIFLPSSYLSLIIALNHNTSLLQLSLNIPDIYSFRHEDVLESWLDGTLVAHWGLKRVQYHGPTNLATPIYLDRMCPRSLPSLDIVVRTGVLARYPLPTFTACKCPSFCFSEWTEPNPVSMVPECQLVVEDHECTRNSKPYHARCDNSAIVIVPPGCPQPCLQAAFVPNIDHWTCAIKHCTALNCAFRNAADDFVAVRNYLLCDRVRQRVQEGASDVLTHHHRCFHSNYEGDSKEEIEKETFIISVMSMQLMLLAASHCFVEMSKNESYANTRRWIDVCEGRDRLPAHLGLGRDSNVWKRPPSWLLEVWLYSYSEDQEPRLREMCDPLE